LTKTIPVGIHHFALVDDEDYDDLIQFSWNITDTSNSRSPYAIRNLPTQHDGIHRTEGMHQRIAGHERVDHQNGNGLDNRRSNLRAATSSTNKANAPKYRGAYTSAFKGVTWYRRGKRWMAQIVVRGKHHHLGYFDDEVEAAKAYDKAALHFFGEFAYPNFREPSPDQQQ